MSQVTHTTTGSISKYLQQAFNALETYSGDISKNLVSLYSSLKNASNPSEQVSVGLTWKQLEEHLALASFIEQTLTAPIKQDPKYKALISCRQASLEYVQAQLSEDAWACVVAAHRDKDIIQFTMRKDEDLKKLMSETGDQFEMFSVLHGRYLTEALSVPSSKLWKLGHTVGKAIATSGYYGTCPAEKTKWLSIELTDIMMSEKMTRWTGRGEKEVGSWEVLESNVFKDIEDIDFWKDGAETPNVIFERIVQMMQGIEESQIDQANKDDSQNQEDRQAQMGRDQNAERMGSTDLSALSQLTIASDHE